MVLDAQLTDAVARDDLPEWLGGKVAMALAEQIPLTISNAAGKIVFANDAFCALMRYSREDLQCQPYDLIHSDGSPTGLAQEVKAALDSGNTWKGELRTRAKDGRLRWITAAAAALPCDLGQPRYALTTYTEPTNAERLHRSLIENEKQFQHLVEMSPDSLFLIECGLITFANAAALNMLRARNIEDVVARSLFEFFEPTCHDEVQQHLSILTAAPSSATWEMTILAMDGARIPVEIRAVSYFSNGRLVTQGACRDISERKQIEKSLRDERDYASAMLDAIPGTFYHVDDHYRFVRWNERMQEATGYSFEELGKIHALDVFAEDHKSLAASKIAEVFATGHAQVEIDIITKAGDRVPYFLTGVRFEHGGKHGFVGVGTNIAERKQMEEALRAETARFEAQVESSVDGILVVDQRGQKVIQNQRLQELWHIPPEIAANPNNDPQLEFAANCTKDPEYFISRVHWLVAHPREISSEEIELLDGTILDRYSAPVLDKEGRHYGRIWIHRDITERKLAEQRILHLASHDGLTGLCNRNVIAERIAEAIANSRRSGRQLALLYLDLDRFKVLNDGYGHQFGDELLRVAADRLRSLVRSCDTVARYGGDEFLILLTDLNSETDAHAIARKIVASLNGPITVQNREVHLSGTVGASVFPQDGETAEDLIGSADAAMYRAKEVGRNTYRFFSRDMSEEVGRRADLENRLRKATASGQLYLAYQPKVSLRTGQITGCEALLRWSDPGLGNVSPSRFIPIAEDSGLIVPIGDWVLRTACAQAKAWLDAGLPPLSVAVNISARQLLHRNVVAWVLDTLSAVGLPPAQLEIELTESLIAQDTDRVSAAFGQLRAAGVQLSIDDFGTGYSSLSYLQNFRVDTLKIDQSFVGRMLAEPGNATIVRAAISLAHNLNFRVLAEGVETEAQCELLRENGCDEIQGYYFSRPVSPEQIAAMLSTDRRLQQGMPG